MPQLDVFETTRQKTGEWLNDIARAMGWDNEEQAYKALRATLQALRDRLPVIEAAHFGAQLPMLIRGVYYEGWTPLDKPIKLTRDEFLARVHEAFRHDPFVDPVTVARAVIDVMSTHLDPGLMSKVAGELPADFGSLWPVGAL